MGTNCAPSIAGLFLFCYERDFAASLSHPCLFIYIQGPLLNEEGSLIPNDFVVVAKHINLVTIPQCKQLFGHMVHGRFSAQVWCVFLKLSS